MNTKSKQSKKKSKSNKLESVTNDKKVDQEPELGTNEFLQSLWSKNKSQSIETSKTSNKRKPEEEGSKLDITNKKKRFNNLK